MLSKKKCRVLDSGSAQAALEFIMTYGWAILAVIAAVGALVYFGVLSPDMLLPDRCSLPSGIACIDYRVESYRVVVVLQNALGQDISIDKVTVAGNNQNCIDNESAALHNNDKAIFTVTQCNNGGNNQKFSGILNVSYTPEDGISHQISGTIRSKVVPGSSISTQSVCQNAETNGLCDGLDIVYGIGYKEACCSEHSLCC